MGSGPEPGTGGADETVLAGERTLQPPVPAGAADAAAPEARLHDVPLPRAADAVVPAAERRDRYPTRLHRESAPVPAEPPSATAPAPHADGDELARRLATHRRRQAFWVVVAAVAVSLLALAGLALVLLLT